MPGAARQVRHASEAGPTYRDAEYLGYGVVVELDGRLGHETVHDRWTDLDRDIASPLGGATTRAGPAGPR